MVSTVTDTYSYVYNGSQLSQLTVDGTVINFAYDASGTPIAVTYGGATYYYATNIQGDVVAILNASGTAVVTYTFKYGSDYSKITFSMMEEAIKEVYKDMPGLLEEVLEWFRKNWKGS